MRWTIRLVLCACAAVAVACAGAPRTGRQPRPDPDLITATDLQPLTGVTARQAIERLRPRFLRSRGATSILVTDADRVWVYMDNSRMGGLEVLDQVQVHEIREIRYMSGPDATNRWGVGHAAGAIVLTRK